MSNRIVSKRAHLEKINPNIVKWLKKHDPSLLEEMLPKIDNKEIVIKRLENILALVVKQGFRNSTKQDARVWQYLTEVRRLNYPKADDLVRKIKIFPTEEDFLLGEKAEKLIARIKKSGHRPNLGSGKENSTWQWIKKNLPIEYKNLMISLPSAQEHRVLKKLKNILAFVKIKKRKPNESKTEIDLTNAYYNLMSNTKKTVRKNKFYAPIIKEIESHIIPQKRMITRDFAEKEFRKFKCLTDLYKGDRSLYKQALLKPWFKELRLLCFPDARKLRQPTMRSDGKLYMSASAAADDNSVAISRINRAAKYNRLINGYNFAYCDEHGNVLNSKKMDKRSKTKG